MKGRFYYFQAIQTSLLDFWDDHFAHSVFSQCAKALQTLSSLLQLYDMSVKPICTDVSSAQLLMQ